MSENARRAPRPDDFYRLRIATEPRLSPDGALVAFTVRTSAPAGDGYRSAIWVAPADGSAPARQVTLGAKTDRHPRFSPDGRFLAFLSDRRPIVEEEPAAPKDREDGVQVHLLPLHGPGEARRVTDLPRGVEGFEWSPDGARLVVTSASRGATREADARARGKIPAPKPGERPPSDYRYTDRLGYQYNGLGYLAGREPQLWIVDLEEGTPRPIAKAPNGAHEPAWSPDGSRVAFSTEPTGDSDLRRSRIVVVDVASGRLTTVTGGPDAIFHAPAWADDRTLVAFGGHSPRAEYRTAVWRFAADGSDAGPSAGVDLTSRHDVMPASSMNSDLVPGEHPRLVVDAAGGAALFLAPHLGAYELWRVDVGTGDLVRLTDGRHYLSAFDAVALGEGGVRVAVLRSTPTEPSDVHVADAGRGRAGATAPLALARVSHLNRAVLDELDLREPLERHVEVDGRDIQGWLIPAGDGPRPLVVEIHGGPHTLYGWSPLLEFQVLAGAGMSVFYGNPRGSEGYGLAFNAANLRDWGPGPMRDVLAHVETLVSDGLADPERLGVTGGSYGGYLTNWIVAHDRRFRAALTQRSVADLSVLMLTGDLGGTEWAKEEFGAYPWEDPDFYREMSPLTHAPRIRTPLLIQHAERDLRTTIGQAEALFSVLRKHRRPVRLMLVPDESHELTRSGTPFRRVENLVQIRDWFRHFLMDGKRRMPPLPRARAGR